MIHEDEKCVSYNILIDKIKTYSRSTNATLDAHRKDMNKMVNDISDTENKMTELMAMKNVFRTIIGGTIITFALIVYAYIDKLDKLETDINELKIKVDKMIVQNIQRRP
jgi:outer membrane murein-binding lipoprotein Lpp